MTRTRFAGIGCALALLALGGCFSAPTPALRVIESRLDGVTDDGFVVSLVVEGENRGPDELPLRAVEYSVSMDGREVFRGLRSAEATLPGSGTQTIRLPAAVSRDRWEGPPPAPGTPVAVAGRVTYVSPGIFSRILFDADVIRPSAEFRGETRLGAKE